MSVDINFTPDTPAVGEPAEYQFRYGDELIAYERADRESRARQVLIKVHPDCRVVVHAPLSATEVDIASAMKKTGALDLPTAA